MMREIVMISLFFLSSASFSLTYEEGLAKLKENNIDLKIKKLETSASQSELSESQMALVPGLSAHFSYDKTQGRDDNLSDKATYLELAGELSLSGAQFQEIKKKKLFHELKQKEEKFKNESVESLYFFNFQKLMGIRKMAKTIEKSRKRLLELKGRIEKGRKSGQVSERILIDLDLREEELKLQELTLLQDEKEAISELSILLNGESVNFTGELRHFHVSFSDNVDISSKDVQRSELNASILEIEENIQFSTLMPKLQYGVEYGRLLKDDRIENDQNETRVFIGLKIPLFDGANLYKYNVNKDLGHIGRLEKQKTLLATKKKMQNLKDRISFLDSEIHIVSKKILLNKKKFKLSLADVRFGQVSFFEVLENEKELFELEKREISATIEMSSHVYDFEEDSGISLEKIFN